MPPTRIKKTIVSIPATSFRMPSSAAGAGGTTALLGSIIGSVGFAMLSRFFLFFLSILGAPTARHLAQAHAVKCLLMIPPRMVAFAVFVQFFFLFLSLHLAPASPTPTHQSVWNKWT